MEEYPNYKSLLQCIDDLTKRIEVLEEENVATTNEIYRLENALESRIDILASECHNTGKYCNF
jgi:cell division protein FtsB